MQSDKKYLTMSALLKDSDYKKWLIELKSAIKQSQLKAAIAVNSQLILLYWDLGRQIVEKQEKAKWGTGFIDQLSKDLKAEFPEMGGFSADNLRYCKVFYSFYANNSISEQAVRKLKNDKKTTAKGQQAVAKIQKANTSKWEQLVLKIPWGHHILILKRVKVISQAEFYITQTIENNWSRAVLEMQIESNLYGRQGKAINNFKTTLPEIDSDLANALLKDPYNFDF
jgi:predicted nuclease of restriction endonuclease-like (RecB) superfamily